jgi:hypothetical protein
MRLKKLRDLVVEAKLYVTRTASYLNIFNFLMIALVFLNTTLWEYDFFQKMFPDRKIFLLLGLVTVVAITGVIGYIDTRYKIWRTEIERSYTSERNPTFVVYAFQCAKMLNDLKNDGKNTKALEDEFNQLFERCGLKKEFEMFKEKVHG